MLINIKFIQICLLLFCITSCIILTRPTTTFIIKNDTGKDLTILTYSKSEIEDSLYIESGNLVQKTFTDPYPVGTGITLFKNTDDYSIIYTELDSLVILFEDNKVIIQYCNGEPLNKSYQLDCMTTSEKDLMSFDTGGTLTRKKHKKQTTKTMVLDEEDYKLAVSL